MERHFGADQDPEFLFNEVISEVPDPVSAVTEEIQQQLVTGELLLKDTRNLEALNSQFATSTEIV